MSFRRTLGAFVILLVALAGQGAAIAQPFNVMTGQYKLPAGIDSTVSPEMATELWARVWRPATGGPYPLLVFLHGNHSTCGRFDSGLGVRVDDNSQYTFDGTCPPGYVVTPNHEGYDYLALPLARQGFVVVSINANRGVNAAPGVDGDNGLNLRRGRLVLRHLQQLAQWNQSGGAPPSLGFQITGLLDLTRVGLMGHSRGGEGMRAALGQLRDTGSPWPARIGPITIKALFEIGPVDGQTDRTLNATNVDWNVLLPGCDGDVSDLEGVRPFDRMLKITTESGIFPKSTFQVFGANHNFYNSEWKVSDASGCTNQTPLFGPPGGSVPQRSTAIHTLLPFFFQYVGGLPGFASRFDPSLPLPPALASVTSYARGLSWSPVAFYNFNVDEFDQATGISSHLFANQFSGLTEYVHGMASFTHDSTQRAAAVSWNSTGGFLQVNATAPGTGVNVTAFRSLEFRVALRCRASCSSFPRVMTGDIDFLIAVANGNGTLSTPIRLKTRAAVYSPAGSQGSGVNKVLSTVRINLSDFAGGNPANFRGVRFIFNQTPAASVYLANVRLTRFTAGPGGAPPPQLVADGAVAQAPAEDDVNRIVAIRAINAATVAAIPGRAPVFELELASTRPFPVSDALPTLSIGGRIFTLSRFLSGKTDRMIFTIDAADFVEIANGAEVRLQIGGAPPWAFGTLQK